MNALTEVQMAATLTAAFIELQLAQGESNPTLIGHELETFACALAPVLLRRLSQFQPHPEESDQPDQPDPAKQDTDDEDDPHGLRERKAGLLEHARQLDVPCECLCFVGYLGEAPDPAEADPEGRGLLATDENGLTLRAVREWRLIEPDARSIEVVVPLGTPREEVPALLAKLYAFIDSRPDALTAEAYGPGPAADEEGEEGEEGEPA